MSTVGRGDCYGRGRGYQSPHHRGRTCDTFPAPGILVYIGESTGILTVAQIFPRANYLNFRLLAVVSHVAARGAVRKEQ